MTAGLWMPPAVVAGAFMFLWGMTLLDRLVAAPLLLTAPLAVEKAGTCSVAKSEPAEPVGQTADSVP